MIFLGLSALLAFGALSPALDQVLGLYFFYYGSPTKTLACAAVSVCLSAAALRLWCGSWRLPWRTYAVFGVPALAFALWVGYDVFREIPWMPNRWSNPFPHRIEIFEDVERGLTRDELNQEMGSNGAMRLFARQRLFRAWWLRNRT
ncbi:MAG: hypothetical protein ACHQ50_05310 [Fimbriimonadales bacterium]